MRFVLIAFFLLLYSHNSNACDCIIVSLKVEIEQSSEIFQGTVKGVEKVFDGIIYEFIIDKLWKGELKQAKKIKTGFGEADCGIKLEIGKSYVIFSNSGKTNRCKRNAEINKTYDDLKLDYLFADELKSNSFKTDEYKLNHNESNYLNKQFDTIDYDFTGKRIAFTSSNTITSKQQWFKTNIYHDKPVIQLIRLSTEEKKELNIDAILVTWSKMKITGKKRKRLINKIKNRADM